MVSFYYQIERGFMKRLIFLLISLSIAVTIPVSAEEVKLTTIVPDQTILRVRQGAVGDTYKSNTSLPDRGLIVEGNIGIGTTSPNAKLEVSGDIAAAGGVKIGMVTAAAAPSNAGTIRYDNVSTKLEYSNGTTWGGTGGAELYNLEGGTLANTSGSSVTGNPLQKSKSIFMTVRVYALADGTWRTVSWTNTPFTHIYALTITDEIGAGIITGQILTTGSFRFRLGSTTGRWCTAILAGD